ncbi:thioredoxin family protein [Pendulispora rubella]|uniref:Thioredoxin family protein n=1 Tax=Pendulispora rubella TaxID=2741070 RepID=A0ABZ2KQX3_9BACT
MASLAQRAAEGDPRVHAELRGGGPDGLRALLARYDATPASEVLARTNLQRAIDAVAKQRDAHVSRLYWYTDLNEAMGAARRQGRPILALRMLGNLDEELSCANSRFFRTALYANRELSAYLREHFVLVWQSERPAPVITIDFRDGRKVVRTITGNSIHYVLDVQGRPVDALPGLYGPGAFRRGLENAESLARRVGSFEESAWRQAMETHHRAALQALVSDWAPTLRRASLPEMPFPGDASASGALVGNDQVLPPAYMAMPVAPSKAAVETPPLRAIERGTPPRDPVPWRHIGRAFAEDAQLDASSVELLRAKRPRNWADAQRPGAPLDARGVAGLIAEFEANMAEDTAKNEFSLHATLHRWFAEAPYDLNELDKRVYSTLFYTPASDPWLGLVPPNAYTGIQDDGIEAR